MAVGLTVVPSAPHLNELAQVGQARLLGIWDFSNEDEDAVNNGFLVLEATILAQHAGKEVHEGTVLLGELEAQRPNGLHNNNLELVCNVCHESADLQASRLCHSMSLLCSVQQRSTCTCQCISPVSADMSRHCKCNLHHK